MKDKDILRKDDALYRSYKEKDRRAILNEFPYGWNQKFELECCMDNNIDVKPITNINIKSYTMCAYRELASKRFPFETIEMIIDPYFSESKVNILFKCAIRHFDIKKLYNKDYQYIKDFYERNK